MNSKRCCKCALDTAATVSDFCCCGNQETFLCKEHLSEHLKKNAVHIVLPVSTFGQHLISGFLEKLEKRKEAHWTGVAELQNNIRAIDTCIEQFTTKVEELVWCVTEFAQRTISDLHTHKAKLQTEIREAIAEAEAALYSESPILHSLIAKGLREFVPGQDRLVLFRYTMWGEKLPQRIDDLIQYEVTLPSGKTTHRTTRSGYGSDNLTGAVLPIVSGSTLKRYNTLTEYTAVSSLSVSFSLSSVFCPIDSDSVLCLVGGNPPLSTAYILSLSKSTVTEIQPMTTPRILPGVIKTGNFAYLFGGGDGIKAITASEKLDTVEKSWSVLPDMNHPRSGFSPCFFEDEIYLPDVGHSHRVIETFSVISEKYRILGVALPSSLSNSSVAFVAEGEMVVVTYSKQVGRWRIGTEEEFRTKSLSMRDYHSGLSNIPPVKIGRDVYWVRWNDGAPVKFNLDSRTLTD